MSAYKIFTINYFLDYEYRFFYKENGEYNEIQNYIQQKSTPT